MLFLHIFFLHTFPVISGKAVLVYATTAFFLAELSSVHLKMMAE